MPFSANAASAPQFACRPEKAIEHLESGIASEECATRTVALLKSISQVPYINASPMFSYC